MHRVSFKAEQLYVIAVVSNPIRFKSRYKLYHQFAHEMKQAGVKLVTVEAAFGEREWHCVEPGNPFHHQLRSSDEIWLKESMINYAIKRLPSDWKYVAWIDADVTFLNPTWATEALHQLQHFQIVQLFQHAIDMGPSGEVLKDSQGKSAVHHGFGFQHRSRAQRGKGYTFWHPGFAWAARREAIESLPYHRLMDCPAILGAGDHHMALAMVGRARESLPHGIHPHYVEMVIQFEDHCRRYIKQDIGFVPGTIIHHFHGSKESRQYVKRWDILTKHQFDPYTDVSRDPFGLLALVEPWCDRQVRLRDDLRTYFRQRNEDALVLE
jgi:hypothetical protein